MKLTSRLVCWLLASAALNAGPLAQAAEIPPPVIPAGVGVNIHFITGHEQDLDLIQAAGFKFIRMDFAWSGTEPKKGVYDWSSYDQLLANLDKRDIRALFILDYSHHLYEETVSSTNPITHLPHRTTASPQHPESIAAYACWAAAAARHFHGRHIIWEIWNEPNIQFWSPKPDGEQYSALALATCKAIREAEPEVTIIGPASSTFPWEFLETFLRSGVLGYLDAVSVHPYRGPSHPPETAAADYAKLWQLLLKYEPVSRREKIPILSGEWGYSSCTRGVSLEQQAAFAARQQLANLLNGVLLSIWYDWKNDGDDPKENEHNFGTVLPDLKPKPAYTAIKTLTHTLSGCSLLQRKTLASDKDYVLLFSDAPFRASAPGRITVAAWTLADPHEVTLELTANSGPEFAAVRSNGEPFSPKVESGRLVLPLAAAPVYVRLGETGLK
jgi:hypothetical protein